MTTGRHLFPDRPNDPRGTVYLAHLDRPLAGSTAQHYIGWTALETEMRNLRHMNGNGSHFLLQAKVEGISWQIVRTWPNVTRREEFRLKNLGKTRERLCPICREKLGIGRRRHTLRGADGRFRTNS